MGDDDRKLTYSERDRMRREGGGPKGGRARAEEERRSRHALEVADSLFASNDEPGGEEGKALAAAVRNAHGTAELPAACRAYQDALGPPAATELISIFLDAGEKSLSISALDQLLAMKSAGALELEGGLKRQIRILSEDFDDDLASRAEELLE